MVDPCGISGRKMEFRGRMDALALAEGRASPVQGDRLNLQVRRSVLTQMSIFR